MCEYVFSKMRHYTYSRIPALIRNFVHFFLHLSAIEISDSEALKKVLLKIIKNMKLNLKIYLSWSNAKNDCDRLRRAISSTKYQYFTYLEIGSSLLVKVILGRHTAISIN